MAFDRLTRVVLGVLAAAVMTACSGNAGSPPPFFTGTPAPAAQLSAVPGAITFSGTGAAYAQTVTVTSNVASPVAVDPGTCGSGATAIVTFGTPAASGLTSTDTVTPQKTGTCTATFSAAGGSAAVTFTVNTAFVTAVVSPNATSLTVAVLNVNGSAPTAAQVPASVNPTVAALSTGAGGNCAPAAGGALSCTVAVPAPVGAVSYGFAVKDGSSNLLATAVATFTVTTGTQTFAPQLSAVVRTVTVVAPTLKVGTAFSGPITVNAFDADGRQIAGSASYANPFTLTDGDATGHTSLTNGAVTGATVTVGTPNDIVIVNYDGAGPAHTFAITAGGGTQAGTPAVTGGGNVTVTP